MMEDGSILGGMSKGKRWEKERAKSNLPLGDPNIYPSASCADNPESTCLDSSPISMTNGR